MSQQKIGIFPRLTLQSIYLLTSGRKEQPKTLAHDQMRGSMDQSSEHLHEQMERILLTRYVNDHLCIN